MKLSGKGKFGPKIYLCNNARKYQKYIQYCHKKAMKSVGVFTGTVVVGITVEDGKTTAVIESNETIPQSPKLFERCIHRGARQYLHFTEACPNEFDVTYTIDALGY